jgi:hypothetical protein
LAEPVKVKEEPVIAEVAPAPKAKAAKKKV